MNTPINTINSPVTIILLGATGDLSQKKIFPSLWDLYKKGVFSKHIFRVIGFSRPELDNEEFRDFIRKSLQKKESLAPHTRYIEEFLSSFTYQTGLFEDGDAYQNIQKEIIRQDEENAICSTKVAYLAVPPSFYDMIFEKIHESGILRTCEGSAGPGRILVEKPFGKDTLTAQALDDKLGKLFDESQIFRIDHYLAKETIQNILNFRFANHIFEPLWSKDSIKSVTIRIVEDFGIEGRGSFYDGVGALRDVGQNHILQMLAVIAMKSPQEFSAQAIREKRLEVLEALVPLCKKVECDQEIVRGQYEGYRKEEGVATDSQTETFFRVHTHLNLPEWEGVPFFLESGKKLAETQTYIRIEFKPSKFALLCPIGNKDGCSNALTFSIKPYEGIELRFWSKKPGFSRELEPHILHFRYDETQETPQVPDAYEHILVEAIRGDQTLFPSTQEIKAQWQFITPVLEKWKELSLVEYKQGEDMNKVGI